MQQCSLPLSSCYQLPPVALLLTLAQLLFLHLLGEEMCSQLQVTVNGIRLNVSSLLQSVVRCMQQLGHTPEYPANSCTELAELELDISSGNYWILNSTQSPVQVFCEMGEVFPASLNVTGGWVRVANLNMTDPDQQCPENFKLSFTNQPIRLCGRTGGCDSVTLSHYFGTSKCVGE